jgi:hypothetical protein
MTDDDRIVADYLRRLRRAARGLPGARRRELIDRSPRTLPKHVHLHEPGRPAAGLGVPHPAAARARRPGGGGNPAAGPGEADPRAGTHGGRANSGLTAVSGLTPVRRQRGALGRVTCTTVSRCPSPAKSAGLVVKSGRPSAIATEAIIKSTALRRGSRPAAITAAETCPYARAASTPKGIGSNSCSARCRTSSRRPRSACSS